MATITGVDLMRGTMEGRLPAAPIARLANMRRVGTDEGRDTFEAEPRFEHYHPRGSVHGGWFGNLLDSAIGSAVMTRLSRARLHDPGFKVNILHPAFQSTGLLRAAGRAIHVGRRTATADAGLEDGEGSLYATGTRTCLVMRVSAG